MNEPQIIVTVCFRDFGELYFATFYDEELHKLLYTGGKYGDSIVDMHGRSMENDSRYLNAFAHVDIVVRKRHELIERMDDLLSKGGSRPTAWSEELFYHSCMYFEFALEAKKRGDNHEFAHWVVRSCLAGHIYAQQDLVRLLRTGCGIAKNEEMARFWESKAAFLNDAVRVPICTGEL